MFPVSVQTQQPIEGHFLAQPAIDPPVAALPSSDSIAASCAQNSPNVTECSTTPVMIDRPKLIPPQIAQKFSSQVTAEPTLSELRFLSAMEAFRSFGDQMLSTLGTRLEVFRLELQEISAENLRNLKEAAEKAKASDFWSLLKKIATALVSALSIIIGVSLVATGVGALVGGAMIASGIFSLANMLMCESGAWDWVAEKLANEDEEKRKMLAIHLPCAVGILAGVIGIFGSAGAFAWSGIDFFDKSVMIAQSTLAIFDGATTVGKGYADANVIWSQADLTKTKSKITIQRQQIENTTKSIEGVLDGLNAANTKASQLIKMAVRSNQAVVELRS